MFLFSFSNNIFHRNSLGLGRKEINVVAMGSRRLVE